MPQEANQRQINQRETDLSDQGPLEEREPPQRQLGKDVSNTRSPLTSNKPIAHDPTPIRHFEPNPLLERPQQARESQETAKQNPTQNTENPCAIQDPFDTQMEVPFAEDIVEPVFKNQR